MKLDAFFERFELFADAPNAVAKMRELVLRLAFSGGLSGKETNDGGMPPGWEKRTIESICSSLTPGFACSRSHQVEGGHVHLRTHNISTLGTLNFDLLVRIDQKMVDPQKSSLRRGDVLFNNTNSQELVGKSALVDRDYDHAYSNHITRLRLKEGVFPGFVVFYLTLLRNSGYFAKLCTRWINQAAVNTDTLKVQSIPLPPLAEQKRIVAKVDELMALCDRLEAQQHERETRHAALARAALARFADAPTPANLDLLFHKSYSISPADLRKSILTLAVQGKLVRFKAEDGKQTVGDHIEFQNGYAFKSEWFRPSGTRLCRNANVSHGILDWRESAFVDDKIGKEFERFALSEGDIVLSLDRPIIATGLKVARVTKADLPCLLLQRVAKPVPKHDQLDLSYFLVWLNSPDFVDSIDPGRSNGVPHISTRQVQSLRFVLPPLAQQRQIVAKVDELMALVDALETQLTTARTTGAILLEAAIHELLNPTAEIIPFPSSKRGSLPDRAAIGCYAIQRLADQRTFGRTAEVKVLYLAEAHLGLDLGGRYLREAAGPLDQWIYKFEEDADRLQWFSVVEGQAKDGHKKIEYRAGPKLSAKAQEASTRLSAAQRSELDRLLGLLAQKPTVEVEIIATLFAAWNDFLIDGRQPSDDEIVREVRENWHPSKQRFTEPELKTWLAWLRRHALVPQGRGPHTVGQQGRLQLH